MNEGWPPGSLGASSGRCPTDQGRAVLYRQIDVWEREAGGRLVRYRCFELLPNLGFCVQSADSFHSEMDHSQSQFLELNALQLLREESPTDRSGVHPTLGDAIAAHKKELGVG